METAGSLYDFRNKLDAFRNVLYALEETREQVKDAYSEGKISNENYTDLKNEISVLYQEIYRKGIDSLNDIRDKGNLHQIKYDIEDTYVKGKITEQHYNLLNKKIQSFADTNENKSSDVKL